MSTRSNKKLNKHKEVAKVETIKGLVCIYDKSQAGVVEHEDNFVMNISLKVGQYAERDQTLFLYNQQLKRMCGIFEAVSVESEAERSYKIHVHVQKRCIPIEGSDLAKLSRECGLKLQGCTEPLTASQVRELVYTFRTLTDSRVPQHAPAPDTRVYTTGYGDGGAVYNDPYLQRAPQRYLPPQAGYDYCPDNYDGNINPGDNHVVDGGYARAPQRMSMTLPEQLPGTYAQMAPVASVDCSRSANPAWKTDMLVCPPDAYGAVYGHPVTSQRNLPDPDCIAYERQARAPGAYPTLPLDYAAADGIPASRAPCGKNGDETGDPGTSNGDLVHPHKKSKRKVETKPPALLKAAREEDPPVSKAKPPPVKRVKLKGHISPPCTLPRKRQVDIQRRQQQKSDKGTVFERLSEAPNRPSVWQRIEHTGKQRRAEQQLQQLQQLHQRKRLRESEIERPGENQLLVKVTELTEANGTVEENLFDFKRRPQRSPESSAQQESRPPKGRRFTRPVLDSETDVKN